MNYTYFLQFPIDCDKNNCPIILSIEPDNKKIKHLYIFINKLKKNILYEFLIFYLY